MAAVSDFSRSHPPWGSAPKCWLASKRFVGPPLGCVGDFPDPSLIGVGGTYYAYSTQVGPCTDRSTVGPWLASDSGGAPPIGLQGPAVFVDGKGRSRLAFDAWDGAVGYPLGARALFTAPLSFPNRRPALG